MTTLARALFLAYALGLDLEVVTDRRPTDVEHVAMFAAWLDVAGPPALPSRSSSPDWGACHGR